MNLNHQTSVLAHFVEKRGKEKEQSIGFNSFFDPWLAAASPDPRQAGGKNNFLHWQQWRDNAEIHIIATHTMRRRSSRLFLVLLHLVGVSTNLPRNSPGYSFWNVGIIGVHPMAILLESLDLRSVGGLDGLLARMRDAGYSGDDLLSEPFWFQDNADGKCLGPAGFSECGDATLWLVRRRKRSGKSSPVESENVEEKGHERKGIFSVFRNAISGNTNGGAWGFALESVDMERLASLSLPNNNVIESKPGRKRGMKRSRDDGECLISTSRMPGKRRRNEGFVEGLGMLSLRMGPCLLDEAWTWRINGDGVLIQDRYALKTAARKRHSGKAQKLMFGPIASVLNAGDKPPAGEAGALEGTDLSCLWRVNSASAVVARCDDENNTTEAPNESSSALPTTTQNQNHSESVPQKSLVKFSLVRYQTTANPLPKLPRLPTAEVAPDVAVRPVNPSRTGEVSSLRGGKSATPQRTSLPEYVSSQEHGDHLPKTMTTSQSHASSPALHPDLKPSSQLLKTPIATAGGGAMQPQKKKTPALLRDSHPGLMLDNARVVSRATSRQKPGRVLDSNNQRLIPQPGGSAPNHQLLHHPHVPKALQQDETPHKPRKIPVHPYIAESKSGVWTDPQTGLEFLTDLCGYLGHDRKTTGRHTLMGVGQYLRTMLKIKVYGVALYVAKRDVLADAAFEKYASLDADQLRERKDFYSHLMHMPSPTDPTQGLFDRTLLLKLNMQLSTDTMRSSLEADWKKLTEEHKDLLISSSFKPRPADERMLRKIQSKENSSNCSCGQFAPEEYMADPSCCARGTELVFTWRKNGDMEVRLDGRVMDTFPRPDLASGIFFEYVRTDDPISVDALNHFADGFPFLLAPLAQVKGVFSPVASHGSVDDSTKVTAGTGSQISRFVGNLAGSMNSHTSEFVSWVQENADGAASNVGDAFRNAGDAARGFGDNLDRWRISVLTQLASIPEQTANFLPTKIPFIKQRGNSMALAMLGDIERESQREWDGGSGNRPEYSQRGRAAPRGKVFRSSIRMLLGDTSSPTPLPDEIGPIIPPTMNFWQKLCLLMMSHLYLMMLLIVSLPGSYTTRTKLVVKKTSTKHQKTAYDVYNPVKAGKLACGDRHGRPDQSPALSESRRRQLNAQSGSGVSVQFQLGKSESVPVGATVAKDNGSSGKGITSTMLVSKARVVLAKSVGKNGISKGVNDEEEEHHIHEESREMKKSLSYFL